MRIACPGGGLAKLDLAISMTFRDRAHECVVVERCRLGDISEWGAALADKTLDTQAVNDPVDAEGAAVQIRPNNLQDRFLQPDEVTETVLWFCFKATRSVNGPAGGER